MKLRKIGTLRCLNKFVGFAKAVVEPSRGNMKCFRVFPMRIDAIGPNATGFNKMRLRMIESD